MVLGIMPSTSMTQSCTGLHSWMTIVSNPKILRVGEVEKTANRKFNNNLLDDMIVFVNWKIEFNKENNIMANIKTDEMAILKAVSIKLDDETVFINTLQYHTEKGDRDG